MKAISTTEGGANRVLDTLFGFAEEGEKLFPEDIVTDYPRKLAMSDVIREKFLARLHQEIPHELGIAVKKIVESGSKLWVNTFWPSVCGGFGNDDDAALEVADPAEVYGQYIDMGATMIQTDRPELLIKYLRSIGRHD